MDKAVVLTSGGLSSAVAAAVVREQYEPALLHIAWGHRSADRELAAFQKTAEALNIEQTMVAELSCMAMFGGNARVSRRIPVEDASTIIKEAPATFALGLMPSMISLATAWAGAISANRIIIGISEENGATKLPIANIYPDYRREFVQTFNLMLKYAKPADRELIVEAPLIELTRTEIIQLGKQFKVPFEHTWSCFVKNDQPCDRCYGCVARSTGFMHSGTPDPLRLETAQIRH